MTDFEEKKL